MVLMSPLLVVALSLTLNKQQGNAEPFQSASLTPAAQSPAWVPTLAQASIPRIIRQGERVVLNGKELSMPWSQRQQEVGIADAGLIASMGVELLDTNTAKQQPVRWFSDHRTTPLNLMPWFNQHYRYLDITELATQFGWQVQVRGDTLQIATPSAQITAVRQGPQDWGDRVVIDLNQPTPWQVSEQAGETVIAIDAQIDPSVVRTFAAKAGKQIQSLKLEARGNQTLLRLTYPGSLRPRIWSLNNPNRLLIDVRPDSLVERNILWTDGIRWQQQWVNLGASQFPVVMLELDPRQSGLSLKPILSNPAGNGGTAPLLTAAKQSQVIAAINAGFFNRNNQLPLGAIRRDHQWLSGPILNRGAIGWNEAGDLKIGHLKLQETLTTSTGQRLTMQATNSGYVGAGVARYTPEWGQKYTTILDAETLITVERNRITKHQPVEKAGQLLSIPREGYLLVVRADQAALSNLAVGTTLQVEAATLPDEFSRYAQILGAGPVLIRDRQVVLNPQSEQFSTSFTQEGAPRSVIATTAEGKIAFVTVHHRINGSGPTLSEVAQIMRQLGAVQALNLDGGSSTTLYLGGQILNRLPSTAARIHNGIGVFLQPNP
ncbi:MAG: phosphodiester glycosidase family protein [Cyanobacteria bacterium RM1_2_2]|nr:phosphodiester glycosidase family protein [Cyanobacteria bacterium RM1_2_2]